MPGLAAYGRDMAQQAQAGLSNLAGMEQRREVANKQMEAAHKQARVANVLGGAAAGATIGAQIGAVGGPAGMVVGALVGLAATELF